MNVKHLARRLAGAAALALLAGCMMAPVRPDLPHLQDAVDARSSRPDEVRLVIWNNSDKLLHGIDNTGRVNVWLNGKAAGGPDIGEYIQLQVPRGQYDVKLVHLDLVEMSSQHRLEALEDPTYVEVRATITSNDLKVHRAPPAWPLKRFAQP
jgi:hypothetical protein